MEDEDFVTYEQALKLKDLGFVEECLYLYNVDGILLDKHKTNSNDVGVNDLYYSHNELLWNKGLNIPLCDSPTLAQAQKWLREEKYIDIEIFMESPPNHVRTYNIYAVSTNKDKHFSIDGEGYKSYEEALSAGITECLKLLEE